MDRVIFRIVKVKNPATGKTEYRYEPIQLSELLTTVKAELAERSDTPASLCAAH